MAVTLYDRVKMSVSGTPGTGAITLGSPVLDAQNGDYMSFAQAGVPNGATVSYVVIDGHNWGKGHGVYTSAGTSLARDAGEVTWNGTTIGSTPLSLTSAAVVMITALAADIPLAATASDIKAGTSSTLAATPAALMGSSAHGPLTDAATIAWNVQTDGYNTKVTLTATGHTMGAPTNLVDGQYVSCDINTGTGGFSLSWNTIWDFAKVGLPTVTAAASKVDTVTGKYSSATGKIRASYINGA